MQRTIWIALLAALSLPVFSQAQGTYPTEPRGVATDIKKAEIDSMLAKMLAGGTAVSDEVVRTFNMANTHHVEIAILHYAVSKPDAKPATNGPEHSVISELNYVIKGAGTMVTGGTLDNAKAADLNNNGTKQLFGPGFNGTLKNPVVRKISEGDLIVVPPNTPHNIYDITSDMELLVIRIDPSKFLELK